MALALRRALQVARQAPASAPAAFAAALQRGFSAGPMGACSGTPEAIFDRKVRAEHDTARP
jgi:hypothetical protein